MITTDGIKLIYDLITTNLLKTQVLINGQAKDAEIQKTVLADNSIKIFVYLDEDFVGTITKYKLITTAGKVFLEKNENITKDNKRGLLVLFEIKLQEG